MCSLKFLSVTSNSSFSVFMINYNAWGELLIEKIECRLQFVFVIEVPCNVQETVNV